MAAAASRRSRGARQSPFFRDMASPIPSRRGARQSPFFRDMASPIPSRRGARQSPFFRDMASPIPSRRGTCSPLSSATGPPQFRPAAASPATLRPRRSPRPPPPPPIFTLDDRYASADFFPDPTASDLLPVASSPSPSAAASSSPSWYWDWAWGRDRGRTSLSAPGSPMDGVVEPSLNHAREEWVTVFGFSIEDTSLVLREFMKCGVMLKHHSGPRGGNWIHILFQRSCEARKALQKNGIQLSSGLIVGVKPIDPVHQHQLEKSFTRSNQGGFMVSLPSESLALKSTGASNQLRALPRPNVTRDAGRRTNRSVATPAKSIVTIVVDWIFGI